MMLENYHVKAVYIKEECQWALYINSSYGWVWALSVPTLSLKNCLITNNEFLGKVHTDIHKSMQAYFYGNDITVVSNETRWCDFVSLANNGSISAI